MLIALGAASAETPHHAAAEWVLRLAGTVTLKRRAQPVADLADLPAETFRVAGINLVGTLVEPRDLKKLRDLVYLRALFLPGPMWNSFSGSKLAPTKN